MPQPYYDVTTWDARRQCFTPQRGVRRGPYTLWGLRRALRRALRRLRALGYSCDRGDPAVLVERREGA